MRNVGSGRLVHANDSRDPVDAGRDRHCPIGTGTIGDQGAVDRSTACPSGSHRGRSTPRPGDSTWCSTIG